MYLTELMQNYVIELRNKPNIKKKPGSVIFPAKTKQNE